MSERTTSIRQFTEASEQLAYEHAKAEESAQQALPTAPLWKTAKRRVAKLRAAGVTDSMDYDPRYGPK